MIGLGLSSFEWMIVHGPDFRAKDKTNGCISMGNVDCRPGRSADNRMKGPAGRPLGFCRVDAPQLTSLSTRE